MPKHRGDGRLTACLERLHAARTMAALALSGGGSGAIARLLRQPGASRTVLEAQVPYAHAALAAYLGAELSGSCSQETADAMARRAFERARALRPGGGVPILGLGSTAALATDRSRRGEHCVFATAFDGFRLGRTALTLAKGARTRAQEESIAEWALLDLLLDAAGEADRPPSPLTPADRLRSSEEFVAPPPGVLVGGAQPWLSFWPDGRVRAGGAAPGAVVSGSFDPLHQGHRALLAAAARRVDAPVAYELSVQNVDKPPLPPQVVAERADQFRGEALLLVTAAPTFIAKARLLPGSAFAVGVDTARRIVAPDYYGGERPRDDALCELGRLGNRFLVAGRREGARFVELSDLPIPAPFQDLFQAIPAGEVRVDISSSALRARRTASS